MISSGKKIAVLRERKNVLEYVTCDGFFFFFFFFFS